MTADMSTYRRMDKKLSRLVAILYRIVDYARDAIFGARGINFWNLTL